MKIALPTLIAAVAVAGVAFTTPADTMEGHTSVSPQDVKRRSCSAIRAGKDILCSGSSSPRAIALLRIRIRSMRSSR